MPELPHGTVTFLFTDIESSTRLWQEHQAAMTGAYARHDMLLRQAVQAQHGVIYKVIGDAFQVAFPTAPAAVAAALAAQLALQAEDWSALGLSVPLRVRMALHTGAVEPDPNGDYRSPVLNRLGRLLSAGHGGQVLLSHITAELVRDVLPAGAGVRDLGEHRLKDLGRPERVFQVVHPVLAGASPPLATLDIQSHNLPVQPTPLIGREGEVAQLAEVLLRDEVQLVTLTGPGGTGKTRLALQAAAEVLEAFPDGVWFVDLSPLTDPNLVPSAIAGVLGVREEGGRPLAEVLADYLHDKQLLLVVDNLEQLLPETAPIIGDLLAVLPGVTVLATSRVPLRLRAEREVAVSPLGLPRRKPPPTLAQLGQYEAVRLFIERAGAVKANFAVTSNNAPAIAEICHRLDGLPLAIELAAARVRMFPPEAMLRRLEQRLTMLTGGARDLPLRQQTLRGAIAWSYELLSSDEQALFRRLSVFAGGFTLEAAETIAAGDELGLDLFEGLERLVEHSLVRQTETEGEPRFTMLETIREFGLEQLATHGEVEEAYGRHAAYFLTVAEEADSALKGDPEQGMWLERLETEHDNLRATLGWGLAYQPETTLLMGVTLIGFWYKRGHVQEGRAWLERALATAPRIGTTVSIRIRAQALRILSTLLYELGEYKSSQAAAEESVLLAKQAGADQVWAEAIHRIACSLGALGDFPLAFARYEEAIMLYRRLGDQDRELQALTDLGVTHCESGDLAKGVAYLEDVLTVARVSKNTHVEGMVALNLGEFARDHQVDFVKAAVGYRTAMRLVSDRPFVIYVLAAIAILAQRTGRFEAATRLLGASDAQIHAIELPLPSLEQDKAEGARHASRDGLGEATFTAAYEAGRALSLEDAVAEALGVADEIAESAGTAD